MRAYEERATCEITIAEDFGKPFQSLTAAAADWLDQSTDHLARRAYLTDKSLRNKLNCQIQSVRMENLPPAFVSSTSCSETEDLQGQVLDLSFRSRDSSDESPHDQGRASSRPDISSSASTGEAHLRPSISQSSFSSNSSFSTRPKRQPTSSSGSRGRSSTNNFRAL